MSDVTVAVLCAIAGGAAIGLLASGHAAAAIAIDLPVLVVLVGTIARIRRRRRAVRRAIDERWRRNVEQWGKRPRA